MKSVVPAALAVFALAGCPAKPAQGPAESSSQPAPGPATPPPATPTPATPTPTPTATAPAAPAAGDPKAEADTIFVQRCVMCHGAKGMGDGPAAAGLNPKPRAYSDAAWQASVTDDYLARVIVGGGAAVGKSAAMPGQADLKDKPEVVKALVAKIRSYGPALIR